MPFIGGAIAGAGSLLGGLFGANAASDASKAQVQASDRAIQAQLAALGVTQSQLSPYYGGGTNALRGLAGNLPDWGNAALTQTPQQFGGLGAPPNLTYDLAALKGQGIPSLSIPDPSNPATIGQFQQSPGYQYALQQSSDAIQNSAAAKTGALSGNMLRALQQNATGLASQDYYNWLNNATNFGLQNYNAYNQQYWNIENLQQQAQTNQYNAADQNYWNQFNAADQTQQQYINRLMNLAQMGQNAAANLGSTGTAIAGNVGNALIGQGNAIAAGQIGGTQALTSGINNSLPYLTQAFGGGGGSGFDPISYLFGSTSPAAYGSTLTTLPFGQGGDWSSAYYG